MENATLTDKNLYSFLEARFPAGGATAFRMPSGERLSYDELRTLTARYGDALLALGVHPGDRVTVQVEKSIAGVALFLATLKVGAIFNPLNTAYTPAEMRYFLEDAAPSLLVTSPAAHEDLEPLAREAGVGAVETLDAEGGGSLVERAASYSGSTQTHPVAEDDVAIIIYTSGTTGQPKGAMIAHGNVASNVAALWRNWGFRPGDVLLHILPIYHIHGLLVALGTAFYNGSEIIWLKRPDFDQIIAALPEASVMMGVPTHYTRLLERPDFGPHLLSNMRLFVSGSAPLLPQVHRAFAERSGHQILERYGMTEAGMIASNPYDGERIPGTVGYPLPGISIRVADENGNALPPGEIGVVEVKGPNIFKGYWRKPDKTEAEFRGDGYFITGDQGVLADDGRLSIVGRAKDMIISGGLNIYPKEIERELDGLDAVGESAVIGVPHPDFGEGVVAVATPGAVSLSEAEILTLLTERLAKFKLPKHVFFIDELPRNAMGKVRKAVLRASYADTFGVSGEGDS